jgi:hypothetical protein
MVTVLALAGASWPSQGPLLCTTSLGGIAPQLGVTVQMNVDDAHRLRSIDLAAGDGVYVALWPVDRASPARRTDAAGTAIAVQRIDFPDWVLVAREIPGALRQSEQRRRRHSCNPPPIP